MTFIEKVKEWVKKTGLANLGWLGGFAVALFAGWKILMGVTIGIFVYTNWNVVRKLWFDLTGKEGGAD